MAKLTTALRHILSAYLQVPYLLAQKSRDANAADAKQMQEMMKGYTAKRYQIFVLMKGLKWSDSRLKPRRLLEPRDRNWIRCV